ncbi:hypothetical protein [Budvicia aquatica]|uniref:Uncharacterized protein n=1 Tax=Budvicia aquatica TaxID=82979 RepID=A0A484ZP87_9GAMM|nr:hypothetical protein [Budvicia aquatica]VFS49213.1 Uncharacterised protein [Budvicia aquatica]
MRPEFQNNLQAMILARQKEQQDIDFSLQADRTNQLANLTRSHSTAQRAGIKDYYANSASNGGTKIELANSVHKYMLGENFFECGNQQFDGESDSGTPFGIMISVGN